MKETRKAAGFYPYDEENSRLNNIEEIEEYYLWRVLFAIYLYNTAICLMEYWIKFNNVKYIKIKWKLDRKQIQCIKKKRKRKRRPQQKKLLR